MNGFLIITMLMGGGSAVAMQNEEIKTVVNDATNKIVYQARHMFKGSRIERIKENGLRYPREEFLNSLTEDQAFEIVSVIDVANANYDWANMTDEEIEEALIIFKTEMEVLFEELGIERPMNQDENRRRNHRGNRGRRDFVPEHDQSEDAPGDIVITDDTV